MSTLVGAKMALTFLDFIKCFVTKIFMQKCFTVKKIYIPYIITYIKFYIYIENVPFPPVFYTKLNKVTDDTRAINEFEFRPNLNLAL